MPNQSLKDEVEGKLHEVKGAITGSKVEELKGKGQGAKGELEAKFQAGRKPAAKRP